MIDEKGRNIRKRAKKRLMRGDCNNLGQKLKNLFSKIKTQTFTILKSNVFFFIRRIQKVISKRSFGRNVLNKLSMLFFWFLQKIKSVLFPQNLRVKLKRSGYVLILMVLFTPVILLSIKYVMDKVTEDEVKIDQVKGTLTYYKKCAKEAALAVAKNWNPGLNLSYQKDALMKVADAVYNDSPCYIQGNTNLYDAVLGLDIKSNSQLTRTNGKFEPIKADYTADQMITQESIMASKEIKYITKPKYTGLARGHYSYWNTLYAMWRSVDVGTNPDKRISNFDEVDEGKRTNVEYSLKHHDIFDQPKQRCIGYLESNATYPNNSRYTGSTNSSSEDFHMTIPSTSNSVDASNKYHPKNVLTSSATYTYENVTASTYKVRSNPNDSTVQISLHNDRIKVSTDASTNCPGTVAYARPAELNVDIVLAIPVNGAACNKNNNDAASVTAGTPFAESASSSISANAKQTPIYQMGQACKNFVKDNFYHIKGVTMGLIPYSAKVSISPDNALKYTVALPPFVEKTQQKAPIYSTSDMYSTSGEKNAALVQGYKTSASGSEESLPTSDTPYYWGGMLTGCPIMCRKGSGSETSDILGVLLTNYPTEYGSYFQFVRMNLNPCLAGYANQLSMKCERKCTHFLPNPYYMIEPTADLVKIYEMCNALYPIYDTNNVSNFLLIPFEWANNFWQSWTRDVTVSASDDTLSLPSKTTPGRKKVLVMLVNKPDWFEPGELTYLGFDNDYSSVPLAESDKIDFGIDYGDTSKKFLDGSSYNTEHTSGEFKGIKNKNSDGTPLIAGPKKIIRFANQSGIARDSSSGSFVCTGRGTGRLYIPRQAMVMLTVSSNEGTIQFTNVGDTTTYIIRDEKTFTIPASNVTSTSGDEYFVEFDVSNLSLISAEVTNSNYAYVHPINTSYNEVEWVGPYGVSDNIKWGEKIEYELACRRTVPQTCTRTVPQTCTRTVPQTCTRTVSKTCTRTVPKTCTRTVPKTCTRTVSKTCTRTVPQTCTRTVTINGPGTIDLQALGGGMRVSDAFTVGGSSGWRWYYFPQALNANGSNVSDWYSGIAYGNSRFVLMSQSGYPAYSTDYGLTWQRPAQVEPTTSYWKSIVWNGSYFVILTSYGGYSTYSSNGSSWDTSTFSVGNVYSSYLDDDLGWDGTNLFALGDDQCVYTTTTKTGKSGWKQYGCNIKRLGDGENWKCFQYDGGYYIVKYLGNKLSYDTNGLASTYMVTTNLPRDVEKVGYSNSPKYWLGLSSYGDLITSTNITNWSDVNSYLSDISGKSSWNGLCYGNSRWIANTTDGDIAILTKTTIPDNGGPASDYNKGQFSLIPSDNVYASGANGWYTNVRNTEETIRIYSPVNTETELTVSPYTPTDNTASITFYDSNGVTQNVGTYNISSSQTFTFSGYSNVSSSSYSPGPNFGYNYGIDKIKYSASNAEISATISSGKQLLRYSPDGVDEGLEVRFSGSMSSYFSSSDDCVSILSYGIKDGYFYWEIEPDSGSSLQMYYSYIDSISDYNICYDHYDNALCVNNYSAIDSGYYYKRIYTDKAGGTLTCNGTNYYGAGKPIVMIIRDPQSYFRLNRFFVRNYNSLAWGGMNQYDDNYIETNQGVTADENWIKFHGDSECKVTVKKKTTLDPSYVRTYLDENGSITTTTTYPIYPWEWNTSGSRYYVDLRLKNAKITKIYQPNKQTTQSYDCSYTQNYDCSYTQNYDCSYTENYDCSYTQNYDCSYTQNYDCSYEDEYDCSYTQNYDCSYEEDYVCPVPYVALRAKDKYTVTYSYVDSSGIRHVKEETFSESDDQDGEWKYYIKLPKGCDGIYAARKYSETEAVYDMIDFTENTTISKNGCLSTDFNGSYDKGFYYFGSSPVTKTITTNAKGGLKLKVAPYFEAYRGYIKYGTTEENIEAPKEIKIKYEDLSNGTMQFTLENCVILYAKLYDVKAEIGNSACYYHAHNLVWYPTPSTSGAISLSGSYSNYSVGEGWQWQHWLKYQSNDDNKLRVWSNSHVSDITTVLGATSPMFADWYMPQDVYTDFANTYLVGPMRLFSPMTRDSSLTPRKYCQMSARDGYDNKANLLWHNFTLPINRVLNWGRYQSSEEEEAVIGLKKATAEVCAKLKTDYGNDLRVYVVKYRKQAKYKTFPVYNVSQSDIDHDYSVVDACATNTGGKTYDISSEADLKTTLDNIADDIKNFAGGVTPASSGWEEFAEVVIPADSDGEEPYVIIR